MSPQQLSHWKTQKYKRNYHKNVTRFGQPFRINRIRNWFCSKIDEAQRENLSLKSQCDRKNWPLKSDHENFDRENGDSIASLDNTLLNLENESDLNLKNQT